MARTDRRLRTAVAVAIGTVVVVLAAAAVAVLSNRDPDPTDLSDLVGPAPERSFIWVKRSPGQFTDDDVRAIAGSYAYVVMDRTHAGSSIAGQLDDVRRFKQVDPTARVYVYVNAAYWYDSNNSPLGWGTRYVRTWSLTDPSTGSPLRFQGVTDRGIADFVDLGNPAYRTYLLAVIRGWAQQAPLDGIAFDSVRPLLPDGPVPDRSGRVWSQVLTPAAIARYDAGLDALLRDARQALGPGRDVLFNGIAESPVTRDRNLAYLADTDTAANEDFCLDENERTDPVTLRDDLRLMTDLSARGARVLEKTNTRTLTDPAQIARLGRFCSAAFLLGWQPGSSYYKFGPGYDAGELTSDPPFARVRVGDPAGPYREDVPGVLRRDFRNGTVVVNLSDRVQDVPAGTDGTALGDGAPRAVGSADALRIGPQDAAVVVRP